METHKYVFLGLNIAVERASVASYKVYFSVAILLGGSCNFGVLKQTFGDNMGGDLMFFLRATDYLLVEHLFSENIAYVFGYIGPDAFFLERVRFIVH